MSVCMRYRRNKQDAVLILNNGFLKIIQNLDRYKSNEIPFDAWIRRIMINAAIDDFRREKKWRESTLFTDQMERSLPDHPINWNEAEQRLDSAHLEAYLQRLSPVTQQVFNLFAIDGYSHKEIAELLKISEGTSKWHVNNARVQLQQWITAELDPII